MDTLFWTSLGAMALLLLARFVLPIVAPDTMLARWLTAAIKFGDDESDPDREQH